MSIKGKIWFFSRGRLIFSPAGERESPNPTRHEGKESHGQKVGHPNMPRFKVGTMHLHREGTQKESRGAAPGPGPKGVKSRVFRESPPQEHPGNQPHQGNR